MILYTVLLMTLLYFQKSEGAKDPFIVFQCSHLSHPENGKSPIVLIHGLASSKSTWDGIFQLLALQTGRKVCAIDLRNHGNSQWDSASDVESMTSDLEKFLKSHGLEKVNLIGHNIGGKIAVHYTLKHPDNVASLIVEDMRPNGIHAEAQTVAKEVIRFMRHFMHSVPARYDVKNAKRYIVDNINKALKKEGIKIGVDEIYAKDMTIRCEEKCRWGMNIDAIERILSRPDIFLTESKGLYRGPVMFIYGTASPYKVGDDKENILKLFPNAKLVPVEGAGYIIHTAYKQFDDEVIKFLNGI